VLVLPTADATSPVTYSRTHADAKRYAYGTLTGTAPLARKRHFLSFENGMPHRSVFIMAQESSPLVPTLMLI